MLRSLGQTGEPARSRWQRRSKHSTPGRITLACERCAELLCSEARQAAFMQSAFQSKNIGCTRSITTQQYQVRTKIWGPDHAAGASLVSPFFTCEELTRQTSDSPQGYERRYVAGIAGGAQQSNEDPRGAHVHS